MDAAKSIRMEKIGRILDIVLNVIFVPILIFVAIFSLSIMITKVTNGVPSVFGYTQIQIISGSMQDAGFKIGETYYVKSINPAELKARDDETGQRGDYIAFFQDFDPNCSSPSMVTPTNRPAQKASDARILFHEIVAIEIDANGERWFTTQGSNNENPDSVKIYQNYVIGRWVEESNFWTDLISFVTSPIGIVCLSVVPCSLIIAVDLYQLIVLSYTYQQLKKQNVVISTPPTDEKTANKKNDNGAKVASAEKKTAKEVGSGSQKTSVQTSSKPTIPPPPKRPVTTQEKTKATTTTAKTDTEKVAKIKIPPPLPKRTETSGSAKIKIPPPPPKKNS